MTVHLHSLSQGSLPSLWPSFMLAPSWRLFLFSWQVFALAILLWWVSVNLGIGMGYHRLLTHRGYKTPKWMEYALTICATLALEGGPIFWVATHRVHHQNADKEGDPHSRVMAASGRTWAGLLPGRCCRTMRPSFFPMSPIFAKTNSMSGSVNGTGFQSRSWEECCLRWVDFRI
jgi:fatty acid desaturase